MSWASATPRLSKSTGAYIVPSLRRDGASNWRFRHTCRSRRFKAIIPMILRSTGCRSAAAP